jgi:hypothetical protein
VSILWLQTRIISDTAFTEDPQKEIKDEKLARVYLNFIN